MAQTETKSQVELLLDVIMKKCLWQFHSRAWDRERQNANILGMTTQLLCGEPVDTSTPENRCYWVDASWLADAYRKRFPWLAELSAGETKALMQALRERLDFLTITGSLNEELTDVHY